ncbi:MAG: hypothetical protein IJQ16_01135 [Selenomonadaceae bacterium]|nr:hypothetical protein [Selenomonadaceae bacterium]
MSLRLFSFFSPFFRKIDGINYPVGYFLDDEGRLKPDDNPAFCFFSTKHDVNLNFIIHAPFLLESSRERILADEDHKKND